MKTSDKIREALNKSPYRDYTYAILFFLVSSFFVIFVIRPVLTIAVSLQREAKELENVNKVYEENITRVLKLQSDLEKTRSRKPLLLEALPEKANVKPLIDDIRKAAEEQGIQLDKVVVSGVYLKESATSESDQPVQPGQVEPETETVSVQLSITGSYDQTRDFIIALLEQRRIKSIKSYTTTNVEFLTKSTLSGVQLELEVDSYYL